MRTLIMILTIVAMLLVGSFTSHRFIQTTTEMIGEQLTTVEESLSNRDWDLAGKNLMTAQYHWEKNNLWWSILIDHQWIDHINHSLKRLEIFIETENFSHSLEELATLKLRFEDIYESEKLNLENFF